MNALDDLESYLLIIVERGSWEGRKRNNYRINLDWDGRLEKRISTELIGQQSLSRMGQQSLSKTDDYGSTEFTKIQTEENIQTKKKDKEKFLLPQEALKLTQLLIDLIAENIPNARVPTEARLNEWAAEADRLHRIDGQSWDEIEKVLRWSQRDSFWKQNILSMGKLRQKWNQLQAKMNGGEYGRNQRPAEPRGFQAVREYKEIIKNNQSR